MITDEKLQELFHAANLGQRLLIKRKELKLSKTDFARRLNVSSYTLSKYEKSEAVPHPALIQTIFEILELNIEDFLTERHQHLLDVRFLLEEERSLMAKRIKEFRRMVRFYEIEYEKVEELLNEECSFATEFEDVDVEFQYSGSGTWLSEKVYLTRGTYMLEVAAETEDLPYTVADLYNIVKNTKSRIFYGEIERNVREPFIIQNSGYYLLHFKDAPEKWEMSIKKVTVND